MSQRPSIPSTLSDADGPLVSVIIPTYGDAEFIKTALKSIAAQTHSNVEAVIVDSTGVDWLADLAAETDWLEYTFQEPTGPSAARNHGIELAEGTYVGFLDADDEWLPEKIERQLDVLEAGADVVYSDAYVIEDGNKRRFTSLPIEDADSVAVDFLYEGGVPIQTVMVRRECLQAEQFDESLPVVEDRHLLVRLFTEYSVERVPEPLVHYNRREDSTSSDAQEMYECELAALNSLFDRYPELEQHRNPLIRKATYKHGKRLLRSGETRAARRKLWSVLRDGSRDPRAIILFCISLLPIGGKRALWHLERVQERLA